MWNDLSMADKAKYIKLAVQNGITNIDNIRNTYNNIKVIIRKHILRDMFQLVFI